MNCKSTDELGKAQKIKKGEARFKSYMDKVNYLIRVGDSYQDVFDALHVATNQAAVLATIEGE